MRIGLRIAVACAVLAGGLFVKPGIAAGSTDGPVMTGVTDVLHGQTTLYPQNDVAVMVNSFPISNNSGLQNDLVPLYSQNSSLSQQGTINQGTFGTSIVDGHQYTPDSVQSSSASGRMFNNGNDVVVTISRGPAQYSYHSVLPTWVLYYWNPADGTKTTTTLNMGLYANAPAIYAKAVMGDFNGDKLADVLCLVESAFNGYTLWSFDISSAANPNQVNSLQQGPASSRDTPPSGAPIPDSIVVGDFDGDGVNDEFAVLLRDGQTILFFKVDPQTLAISQYKSLTLPNAILPGTLAAGHFGTNGKIQIAAAGQLQNDTKTTVYYVDPTKDSSAVVKTASISPTDSYYNGIPINGILARSAPVIASSSPSALPGAPTPDQLILGLQYAPPHNWSGGLVYIGTFNSADQFVLQNATQSPNENGCLLDMQVGNFNNTLNGQAQTGLQLALFENLGSGGAYCAPNFDHGYLNVVILNIGVPAGVQAAPQAPPSGGVTDWLNQASIMSPNVGGYDSLQGVSLLTGDFQGRSLQLGQPSKITLTSQVQPTIVLGAPPMHIDFISPANNTVLINRCAAGTTDANGNCVLNLTYRPTAPSGRRPFNAAYLASSGQQINAQGKDTTSWGIYTQTSFGEKLSLKIPEAGGVKASVKLTAKYKHDSEVSKEYNFYAGTSEKLDRATEQDDHIWFTEATQNVYQYPVLGQTDSQGNQLYVSFSVPSNVSYSETDGSEQDWYQPIQEPGNIFSYPWSKAALSNQFPKGISEVSESGCQVTDTSTGSYTNFWTSQDNTNDTTSVDNAVDANLNASVTISNGVKVFGYGGTVKDSFSEEVGGNGAWNSFSMHGQTITGSQGIRITRGGFNNLGPARYAFKSYIFGTTNLYKDDPTVGSSGTYSVMNLNPNAQVQTTGPLYLGFAVNPMQGGDVSCGANQGWWQQVYTKPDIALNHPTHILWSKTAGTATLLTAPATGSKQPILDNQFYAMKGVWVTNQNGPISANPVGMTVGSANAGEQLTVTARVYNYSLVPTDPSTQVHVRIYAQPVCGDDVCANGAVQLRGTDNNDGDVIIKSIPGFEQTSAPNWALASVNFDTSPFSGQELVFWVVAWLADGNGKVVSEMPAHGLAASVSSFNGVQFRDITDVPLESYSNNVGIYGVNSRFYVRPDSSPSLPGADDNAPAPGAIRSISLSAADTTLRLDRKARIGVAIQAGSTGSAQSTISYYDGNPQAGGQLLTVQHLHELDADAATSNRIFYQPESCGVHDLYAVSSSEGMADQVAKLSVTVGIVPVQQLTLLISYVNQLPVNETLKASLLTPLQDGFMDYSTNRPTQAIALIKAFHQSLKASAVLGQAKLSEDQMNSLLVRSETIVKCGVTVP